MKAYIVESDRKGRVLDIPEFKLRPDYVKIRNVAVALNPTDWKHVDKNADEGAVIGRFR